MKANIIATSCIALLFGVASSANAQLRAGSPEEAAYMKIEAENDSDAKLALMLDFEKNFSTSNPKVLADVFLRMMDIYAAKGDKEKLVEYGDKAIAKDPENVSALLRVSRHYILEKTDKDKAREHAQKARDIIAKLRAQPAPLNQTEAQWKAWLDQNDTAARQYFDAAQ